MSGSEGMKYKDVVDYEKLDPYKLSAMTAALSTSAIFNRFGYEEIEESRGESAFVWSEGDKYRAGVIEGLGTKNLVADQVDELFPDQPSHYYAIAQDSLGMIVNDLIVCGADPQLFWAHTAAGESSWFENERRTKAFNLGCAAVCKEIGLTWAGGESPALPDVIVPGAAEISGFALGEIKPIERYVAGNTLEDGDNIYLVASSGIHANGLSAGRRLSEKLPDGYKTEMPNGSTFGENLLKPTNIYVNLVRKLLDERVKLKRMENITGHGWRKLMRAKTPFTYRMHDLPPTMPIFDFLQEHLQVDDAEMFGNYNMGAGFALYAPRSEENKICAIGDEHDLAIWNAGKVEYGPKQVIIEPKKLVFSGASLAVRK